MYTNIINTLDFTKSNDSYTRSNKIKKQTDYLYNNIKIAIAASSIVAVLSFSLLWGNVPKLHLLLWAGLIAVVTIARYALSEHYKKSFESLKIETWFYLFILGITLNGLLWGVTIILATQQENPLIIELAILLVAGLSIGVTLSTSASLFAFYSFVIPAILPPALYLLVTNDSILVFLAFCLIIYFIFLSILVFNINRYTVELLNIKDANSQIIDTLKLTFDRGTEGVVVIDAESKTIVDANNQAADIFGIDIKDMIDLPYEQLLQELDDKSNKLFDCIQEKRKGLLGLKEYELQSGERVFLALFATVISGGEREFIIVEIIKKIDYLNNYRNILLESENVSADVLEEVALQEDKTRKNLDAQNDTLNSALNNILASVYKVHKVTDRISVNISYDLDEIIAASRQIRDISTDMYYQLKSMH